MGVARVGSPQNASGAAPLTMAIASTGQGNTLIASAACFPRTLTSVTDLTNAGNVWTVDAATADTEAVSSSRQTTGGTTSIKFTWSGGGTVLVWLQEYSGLATASYVAHTAAVNGNSFNLAVASWTPAANNLVFAGLFGHSGTLSAGTHFAIFNAAAGDGSNAEDWLTPDGATATTAPATDDTSGGWYDVAVEYKAAPVVVAAASGGDGMVHRLWSH